MPKGLPSATQLMGKEVSFFSIDTSIIHSEGYKFNAGALNALAIQRPAWMSLQLSEVIEREVLDHRMAPVTETLKHLVSASDKLVRIANLDLSEVDKAVGVLDAEASARANYTSEIREFTQRLGGGILSVDSPSMARDIFARYFQRQPPFENNKEKKMEFPDAAALLTVTQYAKDKHTTGILVSGDDGWGAFADDSPYLYRVKTLDDFTALFESKGVNADLVADKIRQSLQDLESNFSRNIEDSLTDHVEGASWSVDDIYSGYNLRLEGDVCGSSLLRYDIDADSISVWFLEHDPSMCIVELTAMVDSAVRVNVEFFKRDWVDKDEINIGYEEVTRTREVEVEVFLTCRGQLLEQVVEEWDVDVEIAGGDYSISVGEVNPDFSDHD